MRAVTSLKIHFDALIMSEPKKYSGVMCLKNDAKFEEEMTRALKYEMKNLANFDPTLESLKIGTLMSAF